MAGTAVPTLRSVCITFQQPAWSRWLVLTKTAGQMVNGHALRTVKLRPSTTESTENTASAAPDFMVEEYVSSELECPCPSNELQIYVFFTPARGFVVGDSTARHET
jgi:hypothetical protein